MNPAWNRYPANEPDYEDDDAYEPDDSPSYPPDYPPDVRPDDPHLVRLGALLNFAPNDLEANRRGMVTDAQVDLLWQDMRSGFWVAITLFSVLAFLMGFIGAFAIGTLPGLLPSISFMVLALISAVIMRTEQDRLPHARVVSTDIKLGRFAATLRQWGITGKYHGKAVFNLPKGKKLSADDSLNKLLQANREYRAYYAPLRFAWGGYRMLSIEPLGQAPADPITWYEKSKRDKKKKRF